MNKERQPQQPMHPTWRKEHPASQRRTQRRTQRLGFLVALWGLLLVSGCGLGYLVEVPVQERVWQGMRGRIVDGSSGQALQQVRVVVRVATEAAPRRPYYVFSGRDGSFQLASVTRQGEPEPLAPGTRYILLFSSPSHRARQIPVVYQGGNQELGTIELSQDELKGRMRPVVPGKLNPEGVRDPDALRRIGPPIL